MVEDLEGSGFFRVWDYFGGGGHIGFWVQGLRFFGGGGLIGSGFIIRDIILAVILVIGFRARTTEEQ